MATKAKIAKSKKIPKYSTRKMNICLRCGRPRAYMRAFGMCRICFRELVREGRVPGVRLASW